MTTKTAAAAMFCAAGFTALYAALAWPGPRHSSDKCDGGVGDGCTVDRRVEIVHFAGSFYGTGRNRKTEWRVYRKDGWVRYVGPRSLFERTPGAVLVGEMP